MPQTNQVTALMPEWTEDDFYEERVYEWLWNHRNDGFAFQKCLAKVQRQAKELHVQCFTKMYNAYFQAMSPKHQTIGINATDFPDQPVQLQCGKYVCDYEGVRYEGRMGESIWVCRHPIMPVRRIINVDNGNESTQIAFRRGNTKWRELIVSSETIASAQKIIGLAKSGIAVTSENAKEMVKYISEIVSDNIEELPIQSSTGRLGWLPDGQFVPYAEGIEYDGESPENQRMFQAFQEVGNYDTWLETAKQARAGKSVPARIALAGAFAAPLVSMFGALPFIIHFYGTTGMGKSVGLMLSASVWAEPTVGGAYIKTFGGTKVAQELTAAFCCNVPMYIDELQIISDRKSFDDIIYMLCEGASKGRGAKDGGLQLQRRWSNCILTTGEMPIVQSNSGGGAAVRTIEVDYGGVPFFENSREVATTLKQNYGWAGRKFIEALRDESIVEELKKVEKEYEILLSGDIHGKQVLSAAILLAADQIADRVLFHDGHSLTADEIRPYLVTNQQADANFRCYQWLMGVIASNPRRFETTDNNGELWGVREDNIVYIIRTVFDRIMQNEGFSASTFLQWAKRNKKILTDAQGKGTSNNRLTRRKRIDGHQIACVAIVTDELDGFVEVDEEPLPFMED